MVLDIIAAAGHVIYDGVGINANTSAAAAADHGSKVVARAVATMKTVANGLVHEPPRVQLVILGPGIRKHTFLGRKDLDGHVAHLSQSLALQRDVLVRPAEQFNNCASRPALEVLKVISPDQAEPTAT